MNNQLSQMNYILSQWKAKYDIMSSVRLEFIKGEDQILYLNDIQLGLIKLSTLDTAKFDAKQISFLFADYSRIEIVLSWPEEETPYVSSSQYIPPKLESGVTHEEVI